MNSWQPVPHDMIQFDRREEEGEGEWLSSQWQFSNIITNCPEKWFYTKNSGCLWCSQTLINLSMSGKYIMYGPLLTIPCILHGAVFITWTYEPFGQSVCCSSAGATLEQSERETICSDQHWDMSLHFSDMWTCGQAKINHGKAFMGFGGKFKMQLMAATTDSVKVRRRPWMKNNIE